MDLMQQIKDGLTDAPTPEERFDELVERKLKDLRIVKAAQRQLRLMEDPPPSIPKGMTLTERLALDAPFVTYRIDGWLRVGHRAIVAAQFKAGKTTLVANLTRSIVDGVPFLDRFKTWRVNQVSLLDFEMATGDANQLDDWYRRVGIKRTDALTIYGMRGKANTFNILDADVRAAWAEVLRGTEFLIVDCLRPILDAIGLDENHETGRFLVALDALLVDAGIAEAVIVHHMGHQNERSRGDSRLLDWPDVSWKLVRENDDPASKRFISAFGRDVNIAETALNFNPATNRLGIGHGSRRDQKLEEVLDAVLAFVQGQTSPPTQAEIRKALKDDGYTDKPVRNAIRRALADGTLTESKGAGQTKIYEFVPPPANFPGALTSEEAGF